MGSPLRLTLSPSLPPAGRLCRGSHWNPCGVLRWLASRPCCDPQGPRPLPARPQRCGRTAPPTPTPAAPGAPSGRASRTSAAASRSREGARLRGRRGLRSLPRWDLYEGPRRGFQGVAGFAQGGRAPPRGALRIVTLLLTLSSRCTSGWRP